jgi:hypothetical protein
MHGLPVLFPYVALPAIDVQAFPRAVLATGEFIYSAHKKARHDGRAFLIHSYMRRNDRMGG